MKTRGMLTDIGHMKAWGDKPRTFITFEVSARPEDIEKYQDMDLDISFGKHRNRRSLDANACLWGCIGQIAERLRMDTWSVYLYMLGRYGKYTHVSIRPEAVEDLRKQWREIKVVGDSVVDGEVMTHVLCYFGSSTYDSKEFARLLDGVISDMQDLDLETPLRADIREILEGLNERDRRKDSHK